MLQHLAPRAAERIGAPADHPEEQEDAERPRRGHDLAGRERRGEQSDGQERRAHQEHPDIAAEDRPPLDAREVRERQRVEQRQHEQQCVEAEDGQVLAQQHFPVPQGIGQEQLDRAGLPLLGEEPHGDERHQREHQDDRQVPEERSHDAVGDVEVARHLWVHRRAHRRHREVAEDLVEEPAHDRQEDEEHDVGDGRGGVESHLLLEHRPDLHASASATVAPAWPPSSPATIRMKTSSRVMPTRRSSSRSQCCCAASLKISARTSRPRSASTTYRAAPFATIWSSTDSTPEIERMRSRTAGGGPTISTSTRAVGKTCSTRLSIGPWATTEPLLMMMTPLHTIETSGRMCVDKITVCCPARDLMRDRISVICLGSSPIVGSSRTRTSGSLTSACARPTRCRYPFESVPISRFWTSATMQRSITSATRRRRSDRDTPFTSATNSR